MMKYLCLIWVVLAMDPCVASYPHPSCDPAIIKSFESTWSVIGPVNVLKKIATEGPYISSHNYDPFVDSSVECLILSSDGASFTVDLTPYEYYEGSSTTFQVASDGAWHLTSTCGSLQFYSIFANGAGLWYTCSTKEGVYGDPVFSIWIAHKRYYDSCTVSTANLFRGWATNYGFYSTHSSHEICYA